MTTAEADCATAPVCLEPKVRGTRACSRESQRIQRRNVIASSQRVSCNSAVRPRGVWHRAALACGPEALTWHYQGE